VGEKTQSGSALSNLDEWKASLIGRAGPEFKSLIAAGCDENQLLATLDQLRRNLSPDGLEAVTWLDRDVARKFACEIRDLAKRLDQIFTPRYWWLLEHHAQRAWMRRMPSLLKSFAAELDLTLSYGDGRRKTPIRDLLIVEVCQLVRDSTNNWHDREVSALVGPLIDKRVFDAKALEKIRARVQRRKSGASPSVASLPADPSPAVTSRAKLP